MSNPSSDSFKEMCFTLLSLFAEDAHIAHLWDDPKNDTEILERYHRDIMREFYKAKTDVVVEALEKVLYEGRSIGNYRVAIDQAIREARGE